ncbi:hypothetical protein KIL84_000803 [Mauremys mutica]|uniref:Uncharacterized protein n=1 Tax=Mauremys mutica TaxID=74926 RepID=A0A9D3WZP1_9SAUR|nr:hypothetical protein KIL84_000803 [Mauremys mutica]
MLKAIRLHKHFPHVTLPAIIPEHLCGNYSNCLHGKVGHPQSVNGRDGGLETITIIRCSTECLETPASSLAFLPCVSSWTGFPSTCWLRCGILLVFITWYSDKTWKTVVGSD